MKPFSRRRFLESATHATLGLAGFGLAGSRRAVAAKAQQERRPNILFAIADDWGWPHASIAGAMGVNTPIFDRVAKEGILFKNAFCAAPQV